MSTIRTRNNIQNLQMKKAGARKHPMSCRRGNLTSDMIGVPGQDMNKATRRAVMRALRKSSAELGVGRKQKLGRLGAATAIAAVLSGLTGSPIAAQYAAGPGSTASGTGATSVGTSNSATSDIFQAHQIFDRVLGGTYNYPIGVASILSAAVAVGDSNIVTNGGVAIGDSNQIQGGAWTGVAVGEGNLVSGAFGVTSGFGNLSGGTAAVAIGTANTANGNTSIAMGRQSSALSDFSIAQGNVARATAVSAIALGHSTQASGQGSIAIGSGLANTGSNVDNTATRASGINGIAIGTNSNSSANAAIAVGVSANALAGSDLAIGNTANASGGQSIALGSGAIASGTSSISIGTGNNVSGNNSGAIGDPNVITGSGSYAVGNNNTINANNAFAFGNNITIAAGLNGSVGIGNATTVAAPNTGAYSLNAGTIAATAPSSVVSIGASGAERQITNVAAGVLSATSTNAVNGSQLFAVGTALNTANTGIAAALGGGMSITANGTVTAPSYTIGGTTYNDVGSALAAAASGGSYNLTSAASGSGTATGTSVEAIGSGETVTLTAGDNIEVTQAGNNVQFALNPDLTGIDSITTTDGIVIDAAGINLNDLDMTNVASLTTSGGVVLNNTGLNMNNLGITGVAAGATTAGSTDAVNGGQINTALSSVANNMGGGAVYDPITGTVFAPAYTIDGSSYTNAGDAFAAIDSALADATQYFNANSALAASSATGTDSVAVGPESTASGLGSIASGLNADASGDGSSAYGANTVASGDGSTAIGQNSSSIGIGATSVGNGSNANGMFSTAIGNGSTSGGVNSTAIGRTASSAGTSSVALGHDVIASASETVAIGHSSSAFGPGSVSLGSSQVSTGVGAFAGGSSNIANGQGSVALGEGNVAAGDLAGTSPAIGAVAIGEGNTAIGQGSVAIGSGSTAANSGSMALGNAATASNANDIALGSGSVSAAPNSGAFTLNGGTAAATAPTSVLSIGSAGNERQIQNVAAGVLSATSTDAVNGSQLYLAELANTQLADSLETTIGGGLTINPDGTIATPATITLGGIAYNDVTSAIEAGDVKADTGLQDAADALGGGAVYDPATGQISAPSYITGGSASNNVADALSNLDTANTAANDGLAAAIGGGAAVALDGTVTAPAVDVNGTVYSNLTDAIEAAGAGYNLTTGVSGSGIANGTSLEGIGAGETVTFNAGDNLIIDQSANAISYRINPDLTAINSIAVLGGPTIDGSGITLAAGDGFDAGGNALTNLGNGTVASGSTEAVTGDQLFAAAQSADAATDALGQSVADQLGGTASYNAATDTVNGFSANVAGGTESTVTDAIEALDLANSTANDGTAAAIGGGMSVAADGTITAPTIAVGTGSYDNVTDAITAGDTKADTANSGLANAIGGGAAVDADGNVTTPTITVAGTAYDNAAEAIEAGDAKADAGLQDVADALGGGAVYDPATGQISAPSYSTGGLASDNVGDALGNLDTASQTGDSSILTNVIGGGGTLNPDGSVATAASFDVNGTSYATVADAIAASGAGFDLTTGASGSGVANGSTLEGIGAGEQVTLNAGDNLIVDQSGNDVTYSLASDLIGLNSVSATTLYATDVNADALNITGGPTIDGTGITLAAGDGFDAGGNALSGLANGTVASGSTEAVTGDQLATTNSVAGNQAASIETLLGGATSINPDGSVASGPAISVGSGTYNDVTSAIEAGDDKADTLASGLADALGGGALVDADGNVTAPSYTVDGTAYNNVGDAIGALAEDSQYIDFNSSLAAANASGNNASAIGPNAQAAGNNSSAFGVNSAADGNNSTALGSGAVATGTNSVALGSGSIASGPNAGWAGTSFAGQTMSNNVTANGVVSVSGGSTNRQITGVADGAVTATSRDAVNGSQLFDLGNALDDKSDAIASGTAAAIGGGMSVAADGTVTAPTIAVGTGSYDNVTDAITAGDTKADTANSGLANAIGGGAAVDADGNVTAPTITVAGTAYDNAAEAIEAGDAKADAGLQDVADALGGGAVYDPATGQISAPSYMVEGSNYTNVGDAVTAIDNSIGLLNSGLSGLVQQTGGAPGTGDITIGKDTGGTLVDFSGTDGTRTLSGVSNADLTAGSSEAVTGDQVNALSVSIASNLGGGAAFDTLTGTITAPTIAVGGVNYNDTTSAIEAGDAKADTIAAGLANAIGGGASVAPDGSVTAPNVDVNGTSYSNLSDAISAAGAGFNITNGATSGLATGTSIEAIGAGEQVTLNAGSNMIINQTANDFEFALASMLSNIDAIAFTNGMLMNASGINMAGQGITGMAAGSTAAGSTDAVNGGQINTALSSVADNLGGGATYDPVTGVVTAPSYATGGTTNDNVGDALSALDASRLAGDSGLAGIIGGGAAVAPNGMVTAPSFTTGGVTSSTVAEALSNLDDANTTANQGIADALGGGASIAANGTVTAPTYVVDGQTLNNAGDALSAVDNALTGLTNGTSGLVQQAGGAPGAGDISVGADTGGTLISVEGTDGYRIITGVAEGNLATGSVDAVNGGQINTMATSMADALGGGAAFDPGTGTVTAPTYSVGGTSVNTVAGAVDALDDKADAGLQDTANALGGGAIYDPATGNISAPTYTVQGGDVNNVGDAVTAIDNELTDIKTDVAGNSQAIADLANGTSGLVQQTGGAPGTGDISIGADTGGTKVDFNGTDGTRTLTGISDGDVSASSSDAVNGSQLFSVQQTANNALSTNGGTMNGNINMNGNQISGLAGPVNDDDAATKGYVDNGLSDVASMIGGGATYDPVTGQMSAPAYVVGGRSYANVGEAIGASNLLAVQYVPDSNGAPTNQIALGNGTGAVGMTNLAAGQVAAGSTDAINGGQLYAVQQTADGALQRTGGTMTGSINMGGNSINNVGTPLSATDAVNRGYVDNIQAQNTQNFDLLATGLNGAFRNIERNSQGVALAIAMGGGFLSDDKNFSLWGSWGNFDGYNAMAAQTYIRISDDTYINAAMSYGLEEQLVGTRVGFGIQF